MSVGRKGPGVRPKAPTDAPVRGNGLLGSYHSRSHDARSQSDQRHRWTTVSPNSRPNSSTINRGPLEIPSVQLSHSKVSLAPPFRSLIRP
jgi:hypothetical protein